MTSPVTIVLGTCLMIAPDPIVKTSRAIAILSVACLLAGCGYHPDSAVICSADSKESLFARSLSKAQLETLYVDSMRLLASPDRDHFYENDHPTHPRIPDQFAYLKPWKIETFSGDPHSFVSFMLKGCMDEFIDLTVEKDKIVLSYSTGSAVDVGEEELWSADKVTGAK
jgi:hypothetical protein